MQHHHAHASAAGLYDAVYGGGRRSSGGSGGGGGSGSGAASRSTAAALRGVFPAPAPPAATPSSAAAAATALLQAAIGGGAPSRPAPPAVPAGLPSECIAVCAAAPGGGGGSGGGAAAVQVAVWSRDGRYLLTGGQDRVVRLWNPFRAAPGAAARAGEPKPALAVAEYRGAGYEVMDVAVAGDGARVAACGGDRAAFVYDTATGDLARKVYGHEARINACAFNADATLLVTGSDDKTVRVWDLRGPGRTAAQVLADARDNVTRVVVERDAIVAASMDGTLRTWDLRAGRCVTDALGVPLLSAAASHDGATLLAATMVGGGALYLVDRPSGALLNRYAGHACGAYRSVPSLSADDALVVVGSEDGSVHAWDVVDAAVHTTLPAHRRVVSCVAFHPAPATRIMATASFDGTARVWAPRGVDAAALSIKDDDGV